MKEQTHRERKAEEPEKKKRGGRGGGGRKGGRERERERGWGWGGVTKGKTERGPKNDAERAKISVPTRTPQSFSKD